jgi:pterin-4a-carbinolamine dehydratase
VKEELKASLELSPLAQEVVTLRNQLAQVQEKWASSEASLADAEEQLAQVTEDNRGLHLALSEVACVVSGQDATAFDVTCNPAEVVTLVKEQLAQAQREAAKLRQDLDAWGHDKDCARLRGRFKLKVEACNCNITESLASDAGKGWVSPEEHAKVQQEALEWAEHSIGLLTESECQARVDAAVEGVLAALWREAQQLPNPREGTPAFFKGWLHGVEQVSEIIRTRAPKETP